MRSKEWPKLCQMDIPSKTWPSHDIWLRPLKNPMMSLQVYIFYLLLDMRWEPDVKSLEVWQVWIHRQAQTPCKQCAHLAVDMILTAKGKKNATEFVKQTKGEKIILRKHNWVSSFPFIDWWLRHHVCRRLYLRLSLVTFHYFTIFL